MDFSKLDGLIPAVVQDHVSGEVLMVGFMNTDAWEVTRRTGYVTFYSRTRHTLDQGRDVRQQARGPRHPDRLR